MYYAGSSIPEVMCGVVGGLYGCMWKCLCWVRFVFYSGEFSNNQGDCSYASPVMSMICGLIISGYCRNSFGILRRMFCLTWMISSWCFFGTRLAYWMWCGMLLSRFTFLFIPVDHCNHLCLHFMHPYIHASHASLLFRRKHHEVCWKQYS